ncbi:MAG: RnfH family protein [Betaproteobacteria bacterium]|nr:RnfH family protein [Betaproteobacteria bacterium]
MGKLRVEVIEAVPEGHARVGLELEEGATVRHALVAAGRPAARDVGIYGRRVAPDTRLADGDRVEIYRPLSADPKDARRRRALRRRR